MKNQPLLLIFLCVGILFSACQGTTDNAQVETFAKGPDQKFNVNFNFFPPKDLTADASDTAALIKFAWEEFLALNWKSSYNTNNLRDFPDTTWNWGSDSIPYSDLLVWETYAHRTEFQPFDDKILPFDNPPHYSFGVTLNPATNNTSFTLFNNLDENNEIGSCNLYAHVDKYDKSIMVLYQAKVNRDEYEYVLNNYPTKAKIAAAIKKTKSNITSDSAYYKGATSTCNCPADSSVVCLPCGGSPKSSVNPQDTYQGAIEIKTAWRLLVPEDDSTKFFTRKVIFYERGNNNGFIYHNKTFALIGMHIIHKTTNYQNFVFATWEHNTVQQDNMGYVLLKKGNEIGPIQKNYPRHTPIPPLVDQFNDSVHSQIRKMNKNSIWQNYRLVGVQGKPTNDSTSFSFFLANYVIESDTLLADFHGSSFKDGHNHQPNNLLNGKMYSMGGCKGCHGAAQLAGKDFSFLLGGNNKMPDFLDSIPANNIPKLENFIKAFGMK